MTAAAIPTLNRPLKVTCAIRTIEGIEVEIGSGNVFAVLGLTQKSAAERKLMDCLNRLGYDIEIKVQPATEPVGHLMLRLPEWIQSRD